MEKVEGIFHSGQGIYSKGNPAKLDRDDESGSLRRGDSKARGGNFSCRGFEKEEKYLADRIKLELNQVFAEKIQEGKGKCLSKFKTRI